MATLSDKVIIVIGRQNYNLQDKEHRPPVPQYSVFTTLTQVQLLI